MALTHSVMYRCSRGFTLIELIAVIIVLAVISVTAIPRFSNAGASALAGRDDLIAALFYAQQIAMARSRSSADPSLNNPIQLQVSGGNLVQVTEGSGATVRYSVNMPEGVTLSPNTNRSFSKLGATTETTFTVIASDGSSAQVVLEASGYAH